MDERQNQGVQVGAGLQESRLNTDLIDWLKKWGNHILGVVILVVLVYVGAVWYGKYQREQRGEAFAQYEAARGIMGPDGVLLGSPDNLLQIAQQKGDWGSIRELATLDAAEILLGSGRRGIGPGADVLNPTETDLLTESQSTEMMTRAQSLFQSVRDDTAGDETKVLLHLRALWGLAATAASLGEFEKAGAIYDEIATKSEVAEFPDYVIRAEFEKSRLDSFKTPIVAVAEADLPEEMRPRDPGRFSPTNLPTGAGPENAIPIQIGPDGRATIRPTGPQTTTPAGGTTTGGTEGTGTSGGSGGDGQQDQPDDGG